MKMYRILAGAVILSLAACAHYIPAGEVIPAASDVVGIDIVLPNSPGFSLTDQRKIDPIVSFLRQECRWAPSDVGRVESKDVKDRGYQIVVRRMDGTQVAIDVMENGAVASAYHSNLSTRASEALATLCGLEEVRLGSFCCDSR